jgi:hypothetical protein
MEVWFPSGSLPHLASCKCREDREHRFAIPSVKNFLLADRNGTRYLLALKTGRYQMDVEAKVEIDTRTVFAFAIQCVL